MIRYITYGYTYMQIHSLLVRFPVGIRWAGKIILCNKQPQGSATNPRVGHSRNLISTAQQGHSEPHSHSGIQSTRSRTVLNSSPHSCWLCGKERTPKSACRVSTQKYLLLAFHWPGLVTWSCLTARDREGGGRGRGLGRSKGTIWRITLSATPKDQKSALENLLHSR